MQVKVVGGRSEMPSQNKQSPCCLTRSVHKAKVGQLGSRYVPLFWTIQKAVFIPPEIKAAMGGSSFHHVQSGLLSGIHCMLSCQGHTELNTKQGGGGGERHALRVKVCTWRQRVARAESAAVVLTLHCVCVAIKICPLRTAHLFQVRSVCAGYTLSMHEPESPLQNPSKQ